MKLYKLYIFDHGHHGNEIFIPINIDGNSIKILSLAPFEEKWDVDWLVDDNAVNNKVMDLEYPEKYRDELQRLIMYLFEEL